VAAGILMGFASMSAELAERIMHFTQLGLLEEESACRFAVWLLSGVLSHSPGADLRVLLSGLQSPDPVRGARAARRLGELLRRSSLLVSNRLLDALLDAVQGPAFNEGKAESIRELSRAYPVLGPEERARVRSVVERRLGDAQAKLPPQETKVLQHCVATLDNLERFQGIDPHGDSNRKVWRFKRAHDGSLRYSGFDTRVYSEASDSLDCASHHHAECVALLGIFRGKAEGVETLAKFIIGASGEQRQKVLRALIWLLDRRGETAFVRAAWRARREIEDFVRMRWGPSLMLLTLDELQAALIDRGFDEWLTKAIAMGCLRSPLPLRRLSAEVASCRDEMRQRRAAMSLHSIVLNAQDMDPGVATKIAHSFGQATRHTKFAPETQTFLGRLQAEILERRDSRLRWSEPKVRRRAS